jgi:hypothetical protein
MHHTAPDGDGIGRYLNGGSVIDEVNAVFIHLGPLGHIKLILYIVVAVPVQQGIV